MNEIQTRNAAVDLIDSKLVPDIERIESIAMAIQPENLNKLGPMMRAARLSASIATMRRIVLNNEMLARMLMDLRGSAIGFRTDRDREGREGGYAWPVVAECFFEAMFKGARPVGNEWNIIGGNMYLTGPYFARMVQEFPGLHDLHLKPGVPKRMGDEGALVPYAATWMLGTEVFRMELEIPVRINKGMGADGILGKAKRKMLAAIYGRLTGSELITGDGEVDDDPADAIMSRMEAAKAAEKPQEKTPEPQTKPPAPTIGELPKIQGPE